MIRFDSIHVRYGDFVAIPRLDLQVEEGEFFTLLGPSGCGKTTALRTLAGFVSPSSGEIYVAGKRITHAPSEKREVGMVFQNYALFPSMDVEENIAFGLRVRKEDRGDVARRVREMADQVGLSREQLTKSVADLSGGQQQRVAIARALVLKPKILLLDEPLSNLDAKLRTQLRIQLKDLQEQFGVTTVYVTHDQDEALSMSDRIAVFNKGRVEQVGTPEEIYDASATEFVCTFIGDASWLPPEVMAQVDGTRSGDLDPCRASYIREEKVLIRPADAGAPGVRGRVVRRRYHGTRSSYEVSVAGSVIKVMQPESRAPRLAIGDDVTLTIDPRDVLQYDRGTVDFHTSVTAPDPAGAAR
jgi:iron(III) transport system ATP-binding protein